MTITPQIRVSVVDYVTAAAHHLNLPCSCLHRAVAYLDDILAVKHLQLQQSQPVAMACLWVAAKFELGSGIPAAQEFAALVLTPDGRVMGVSPSAKKLLVRLEQHVLRALQYKLAGKLTAADFMQCICAGITSSNYASSSSSDRATGYVGQELQHISYMASYLTDMALLEYNLLPCPVSQIAAAAWAYAHALLVVPLNVQLFQTLTGHCLEEVKMAMQHLAALFSTLTTSLELGTPYAVT
eukprot:gene11080-11236_t